MIYMIAYDISSDRSRTKISNRLIKEGYERIQYSVYLGLNDPRMDICLWKYLNDNCNKESGGQMIILPLKRQHVRLMSVVGNHQYDIDYLLGEKRSLTF